MQEHSTSQQSPAILGAMPLTMSSREVAERTGKEHKNVLRDIRNMLIELGLGSAQFSADVPDSYGRLQPGYLLPKRECLVLVSGYSVELRAAIIDRWQELETQDAKPRLVVDPSDPKVMLAVFDHLQKQVAEKDEIIATQGVQVKKLERLEGAKGTMCISDAAKTLGVGRDALFARMQADASDLQDAVIDAHVYGRRGGWVFHENARGKPLGFILPTLVDAERSNLSIRRQALVDNQHPSA